jgi:hypothetical protein
MAAPRREVVTEYLRRVPNLIARAFWFVLWLIVGIIRVGWLLYLTLFVLAAVVVFAMFLLDGALWMAPLVAFFAFAFFVQFRNRSRRAHR